MFSSSPSVGGVEKLMEVQTRAGKHQAWKNHGESRNEASGPFFSFNLVAFEALNSSYGQAKGQNPPLRTLPPYFWWVSRLSPFEAHI